MPEKITIKINGKEIRAEKGKTILEIAKENNIEIPALCFHPDLKPSSSCRLCCVEIKDKGDLVPACSTIAEDNMEIFSESLDVKKARKTNLELLFSQHKEECPDCVYQNKCYLKDLAKKYGAEINHYQDRKTNFPVYQFGPALIFDSSKCIDCGNCIAACKNQAVNYLRKKENKEFFQVCPVPGRECIYCGQCLTHCPAGAFEAVGEFEDIEKPLLDKTKTVVFQIAPAIRTTLGEELGINNNQDLTNKIVAGIKKLGADFVFDVSVGADFTTFEEAKEMINKIEKGACATLFSSCCPAWVRFVELYYPEFLPQIATVRPPHIISGTLIKTYFAKTLRQAQGRQIDPKDIIVASIMPCVAKKYEITRKEMLFEYENEIHKPVDYVLTTRELAMLFLKHNINLKKIRARRPDKPLGEPSGGGVIFGASGGVMESALRVAAKHFAPRKKISLDFKETRGSAGIKEAEIEIADKKLKVAIVNGTGNAKIVLEKLKENPSYYNCVEVMACPNGCVGGGGQPLPSFPEQRTQRAEGLYKIDEKKKIKASSQNPIIKKVYKEFLNNPEIIEKLCHTKYNS